MTRAGLGARLGRWAVSIRAQARITKYLASGRRPWTHGYWEYREKILREVLGDRDLLDRFSQQRELPSHYGLRLDERIVEYPWLMARLAATLRRLLDAGAALNHEYLLRLPVLQRRAIVMCTLAPEDLIVNRENVGYVCGDVRRPLFRSECFDEIACVSTLEHVGMNNTRLYSKNPRFAEYKPHDYQDVIREFHRLLKPGGRLFLTVPFGRYENHGWLQQFDRERVERVLEIFGGSASKVAYYQYAADGWHVASGEACADCTYFDIHARRDYEEDFVAAARAVACIEMAK